MGTELDGAVSISLWHVWAGLSIRLSEGTEP